MPTPGGPREVVIATSVGGGPAERLTRALSNAGVSSTLSSLFDPAEWRARMAGTRGDRLSARVGAALLFPTKVLREATRKRGSAVVPTTNPFFLPAVAVATRWLHHNRVVPLVYDLYPDALEAGGLAARGGVVDFLTTALNRWWLRRADGVVFIGPGMAEHVCSRYATPRAWTVIETGAEVHEFEHCEGPPESELERWCQGKTVISYVGNMGQVHDWETLAEAIPRVVAAHQGVGVVVAASGAAVAELEARWRSLPRDVVRFEAPLPDRAWARLLVRSAISVSTLREAARRTSIPSKTFSAMAAGSAIVAVAPDDSDLSNLVKKHACGCVVSPGDVDGLAASMGRLLDDPDELRRARSNASSAARQVYDMPMLASRWADFLRRVFAPGDNAGY
jgi:glycosyltransferase involved in cell wall biosynthesis